MLLLLLGLAALAGGSALGLGALDYADHTSDQHVAGIGAVIPTIGALALLIFGLGCVIAWALIELPVLRGRKADREPRRVPAGFRAHLD